jgi:hypothetical protein
MEKVMSYLMTQLFDGGLVATGLSQLFNYSLSILQQSFGPPQVTQQSLLHFYT